MTQRAADDEHAKSLLARMRAGDQSGFEEFYRAFSHGVFAYLRNQMRNEADAEEVMVDTMCEAWNSANRFRGDSRVTTWLIGIARYKSLMKIRSVTKGGRAPAFEDVDDLSDRTQFELVQHEPDAVDLIARTQQERGVKKCMQKLSAIHRECLHLFYFQEFSIAELAAMQAVDANLIKGRLFQARVKIKQCLAELCRALGQPI